MHRKGLWRMIQRLFGFEHRDHSLDVPTEIRVASHRLNNEAMKLKSKIGGSPKKRQDCLRELVFAMQDKVTRGD